MAISKKERARLRPTDERLAEMLARIEKRIVEMNALYKNPDQATRLVMDKNEEQAAILIELRSARRRIASAAVLADLLITPKWRSRIESEGIDSPGLLSDVLNELDQEAPDGD